MGFKEGTPIATIPALPALAVFCFSGKTGERDSKSKRGKGFSPLPLASPCSLCGSAQSSHFLNAFTDQLPREFVVVLF